jgi:hypothetical protein
MFDRSDNSSLFVNYLLERRKGGFEVFECFFVVHFACPVLFVGGIIVRTRFFSLLTVKNQEKARIRRAMTNTTCSLLDSAVSTCDDEEHSGQY